MGPRGAFLFPSALFQPLKPRTPGIRELLPGFLLLPRLPDPFKIFLPTRGFKPQIYPSGGRGRGGFGGGFRVRRGRRRCRPK